MKSPVISRTKGFLVSEVMIAFALAILFLTSAIVLSVSSQELKKAAEKNIEYRELLKNNTGSTTLLTKFNYGNDTIEQKNTLISIAASDFENGWGRETCDPRLQFDASKVEVISHVNDLGAGNKSTDLEVRNGVAYISMDSSQTSLPDLYILDVHDPHHPLLLSSINTGPGIAALEVAGPYVYAANVSTTNQLQIIDITNRLAPKLISKFKLPLPNASSTPPLGSSLFYNKGYVYLGTEKWDGDEFSIIDVHIPTNPRFVGSYKTNTLINDIYVAGTEAYLAASDMGQMRVMDIQNPASIQLLSQFSPSGWETQQGKTISFFEDGLFLGRTVGGFNVLTNHEAFNFSSTTELLNSRDVPGGVYGIVYRPPYFYLATHSLGHEFQVWNSSLNQQVFDTSLGFNPQKIVCDNNTFYFATGDEWGIALMHII
jgi:hypothetical protein